MDNKDFEKILKVNKELKYEISGMTYRIDFLETNIKEQENIENYLGISSEKALNHKKEMTESFEDVLMDIVFKTEIMFKKARELYKITEKCIDFNERKDFNKDEIIDANITFEIINDNVLYFKLPELLRIKNLKTRKTNNMTDEIYRHIMREKINEKLDKMFEEKKHIEVFNKHTLVFIHHYTNNSEKDMDNLSLKKVIDALSERLVIDDSMRFNNIIQLSEKDETTYTELYVIRGQEIKENILKFISQKC